MTHKPNILKGGIPSPSASTERVHQPSLGQIIGDTLYTDRSETSIMRAFNGSIGFNYQLLQKGMFKFIVVRFSSGYILRTHRETVLRCGRFLNYGANNPQKQIFLPLAAFWKRSKSLGRKRSPRHGRYLSDAKKIGGCHG